MVGTDRGSLRFVDACPAEIDSPHPPTPQHPPRTTGDCALAVRVLYSDEQHFPARLAVGNVPDPALVFPAAPTAAYVRTY